MSFEDSKWVSESRDWRCWLIYSARRDQFSRLLVFCQSCAIDVVKSLWSSSVECSGMFVTKAFPGRCCGIALVSKRLFKAPETVVILISNLHFWSGVISVHLRWRDICRKTRRDQVVVAFWRFSVRLFKSCASGEVSLF